jgi:hypothetical protein
MNEREKLILRMVLSYAHANVDDINEAFEGCDGSVLVYNDSGVNLSSKMVTHQELADLCKQLVGIELV